MIERVGFGGGEAFGEYSNVDTLGGAGFLARQMANAND
jgi:hypothetical protein